MRCGDVGRSIVRKWWDVISRMHAYVSAIAFFEPHEDLPNDLRLDEKGVER